MSEKVITAQSGVYGRVQVILPLPDKALLLAGVKASGMSKAEFLRKALILGASQLAKEQGNHAGGRLAQKPTSA
jgi:hypothetical protein